MAIQNSAGTFVKPDDNLIQSGAYDVLAKPLYMNVNNDLEMLPTTIPLIRFGMSDDGSDLVNAAGYVPIPPAQRQEILSLLCSTEGAPPSLTCPEDDGVHPAGIAAIVIVVLAVVGVASALIIRKHNGRKEADSGDDSNPYANSRTNWAAQEPEVESPIDEEGQIDFHPDAVDERIEDFSTAKPTPQLV